MYKQLIIFTIVYAVIDILYLQNPFSKKVWNTQIPRIQGQFIDMDYTAGLIAYFLLGLGQGLLILSTMDKYNPYMVGAIYALVVYGVFDMTNKAIFKNWTWFTSIFDIVSGLFVNIISIYVSLKIIEKLKL